MQEEMMQRKDQLLELMNANLHHANRFDEVTTVIELSQFKKGWMNESVRKTESNTKLENIQIKDIPWPP